MADSNKMNENKIIYGVEDLPPFHLTFLCGLQQAIICIGGTLSMPYILTTLLCADGGEDSDAVRSELLSITLFMCGVATILQCSVGVRLPVIQGGSLAFVPSIVTMMALEQFKCSSEAIKRGSAQNSTSDPDDWKMRMREIQGNLILASLTEVLVGCCGVMGFMLRFVGPLTIAPTVALIGFSLTRVVASFADKHWGISFMTVAIILLCSLCIHKVKVPIPTYSREKSCHVARLQLFQLLPVILAICLSWLLCLVLTETDVFPNNSTLPSYSARTDSRLQTIRDAPWFYFPLPIPFGIPTISAAGYVGMLSATISSIIKSLGNYFAAARLSCAPPPPPHALNRGIAVEGFSGVISGLVGAGHATTSYSNNIGCIGITKVGSRIVFITAGIILVICGVVGKIGAALTLIPSPIIGGSMLIGRALVVSMGISVLQFCDMSSTRNIIILGVSFLVGLMIPEWLADNPERVNTGSTEIDESIRVLFGIASFTGGFIGFLLDNIVPGTKKERGIEGWNDKLRKNDNLVNQNMNDTYDLPYITGIIRRFKCCLYIPISPTFNTNIGSQCSTTKEGSTYVNYSDNEAKVENGNATTTPEFSTHL